MGLDLLNQVRVSFESNVLVYTSGFGSLISLVGLESHIPDQTRHMASTLLATEGMDVGRDPITEVCSIPHGYFSYRILVRIVWVPVFKREQLLIQFCTYFFLHSLLMKVIFICKSRDSISTAQGIQYLG